MFIPLPCFLAFYHLWHWHQFSRNGKWTKVIRICIMIRQFPAPALLLLKSAPEPPNRRQQEFNVLHGLFHSRMRINIKLVGSQFWRSKINATAFVCTTKARRWYNKQISYRTLHHLGARLRQIHFRLVQSLPPSKGRTSILACTNRLVRMQKSIPLTDSKVNAVANAFLDCLIVAFYD